MGQGQGQGQGPSTAFVKVTQCESEADQAVAMESAMDTTNRTFAVGHDSDYCVFGYKRDHELWVMGDLNVQYLPLDGLEMDEKGIKGYVLTRQDIAEELHIPEDLILEVCIWGCSIHFPPSKQFD